MAVQEIIPKELFNPQRTNEVIEFLKKAVTSPRRRKEIFIEWCQKVGVKMTSDQVDYLLGGVKI